MLQMNWVVVTNPGTDQQDIESEFRTYNEANRRYHFLFDQGESVDVMKRDESGNLTTEY